MKGKQKNNDPWMRVGVAALVIIAACLLVYGLLIVDFLFFAPDKTFKTVQVSKSLSQLTAEQRAELIRLTSAPNQSQLSPAQEAAVVRSTTARDTNSLTANQRQALITSTSAPVNSQSQ